MQSPCPVPVLTLAAHFPSSVKSVGSPAAPSTTFPSVPLGKATRPVWLFAACALGKCSFLAYLEQTYIKVLRFSNFKELEIYLKTVLKFGVEAQFCNPGLGDMETGGSQNPSSSNTFCNKCVQGPPTSPLPPPQAKARGWKQLRATLHYIDYDLSCLNLSPRCFLKITF